MTETFTNVVDVRLNSAKLADDVAKQLVSVRIDTSVHQPASFEIVFQDSSAELLEKGLSRAKIGAKVKIAPLEDGKPGKTLVTGELTGLTREMDAGRRKRLVLRGYDMGHRLTRRRKVQAYPKSKASDIARKIFGENGVPVGTVTATTAVYDHASQPNMTDWDYLARLAQENDRRLFVDRDGKAQFAKTEPASGAPTGTRTSADPFVLSLENSGVHHCRIDVSASGLTDTAEVRGWDVKAKRALSSAVRNIDTPAVSATSKPNALKRRVKTSKLVATAEPFTTQAQVKATAAALAEEVASSVVEIEAAVDGDAKLIAGEPIAVVDAGKQFNGKYTLSAARHLFGEAAPGGRYTTELEVSGRRNRSLYGLVSDGGDGPVGSATASVAIATVKDVKAPRQHKGKVKLSFPWLSADYESDWCRVVQFGGVKGGGLNLPNTGDEVFVGFDRGSLEQPYVIAGLYNGKDAAPKLDGKEISWSAAGAMDWRTLASRDDHRVELHDSVRKKGVKLSTGNNRHSIHLDQSGTRIFVNSSGEVSIRAARNVSINARTSIDLSARGAVNISGSSVNINAQSAGTFRAGAALSLNAGASFSAVGETNAQLSSPGRVGLQAGAALNVIGGGATTVTAGGALALTAGAATTLTAAAATTITSATFTLVTPAAFKTSPLLGGAPVPFPF